MSTVLALAGWVCFDSPAQKAAWQKKLVASHKLTGWEAPMEAPTDPSPLDTASIASLWEEAKKAPEPIEIAETETTLRFAAALASVTGRAVWAPAFLAAVRRAAGSGRGGAWAVVAEERGSILAVELAQKGAFRRLDEDAEVEAALSEPELARAFALTSGDAPPPALADLPPRAIEIAFRAEPAANAKRGARSAKAATPAASVAAPRSAPGKAKPPPVARRIPLRVQGGMQGVARLPNGDVLLLNNFGVLVRGNPDTFAWTPQKLDLGKLWWITTHGSEIWIGADTGLFVSEDDGATFIRRCPDDLRANKPLFVEGAMLVAAGAEILRSTDGGVSFQGVLSTGDCYGVSSLAHRGGGLVVGVGPCGRVFSSNDDGRSFRRVRDGNDESLDGATIEGDDCWYVGSTRILRADAAAPGEIVDVGPKRDRNASYRVVRAFAGTVWVTNELNVLRSHDRGASWEVVIEKPVVFTDLLPLGPRRAIVVGSEGTAFSLDGLAAMAFTIGSAAPRRREIRCVVRTASL